MDTDRMIITASELTELIRKTYGINAVDVQMTSTGSLKVDYFKNK